VDAIHTAARVPAAHAQLVTLALASMLVSVRLAHPAVQPVLTTSVDHATPATP
jgi:hypothetical protein